MTNWQPIEAAPGDTRVLLYFPAGNHPTGIMVTGYYSVDLEMWVCDLPHMGFDWVTKHPPTHWHELEGPTT